MPRRNRKGPEGEGPMTGRGLGYCGGPGNRPRFGERGSMVRRRLRSGRGSGWSGQRFAAPQNPPTAEEELNYR